MASPHGTGGATRRAPSWHVSWRERLGGCCLCFSCPQGPPEPLTRVPQLRPWGWCLRGCRLSSSFEDGPGPALPKPVGFSQGGVLGHLAIEGALCARWVEVGQVPGTRSTGEPRYQPPRGSASSRASHGLSAPRAPGGCKRRPGSRCPRAPRCRLSSARAATRLPEPRLPPLPRPPEDVPPRGKTSATITTPRPACPARVAPRRGSRQASPWGTRGL